MPSDLVSVVIPTYNKGKFIVETLDSVLHQTYENIEVLLVDNGSTDDTRARIDEYLNSCPGNYRVIDLVENKGPSNARNVGILEAKGKYVFLLDGDDLLMPEKIGQQVHYMDANLEVGLSLTPYLIYSATRKVSIRLVSEVNPNKLIRGWIGMSHFGGLVESTGCIRRANLDSTLLFDLSLMGSEGLDFTIKWRDRFPVGVLREPLTLYRISSDGLHYDLLAINENIIRVTNRYISHQTEKAKLLAQQDAFFRLDKIRYESIFIIISYLSRALIALDTPIIKMTCWIITRNVKSAFFGILYRGKIRALLDSLSSCESDLH